MQQVNEKTGIQKINPEYVTIIICTFLSIFFMNTGFFTLLYLAPLGYAVIVCRRPWLVFFAAAAANVLISVVMRQNISGLWIEIFYYTTLFLMYIWIMGNWQRQETVRINEDENADNSKEALSLVSLSGILCARTAYRFIAGSVISAAVFLLFISGENSNFYATLELIAKALSENIGASTEAVTRIMSPENIAGTVKHFIFRGGALFTMFFLFFINRQAALAVVRIVKKQDNGRGLIDFFAPPNAIWVFFGALATVLATRLLKTELLEILAWNVFTVCGIIFLAQGAGILLYLLSMRTNAFRLAAGVLIIVLMFSPLGMFAITALLLLGIAEYWRPIRMARK